MRRLLAAAASALVGAALLVGPASPAAHAATDTQPAQAGLVTDDPANFTPHVLDGQVDAIAVVGNKVILGGQFTRARNASGGAEVTRVNLLAFNRTTGVIDTSFVANADGRVRTLVPGPDGQSVYVGGQFNNLGGQPASKLARLNINTGLKVAGFNPKVFNALIYDAKLVGNKLFVAGQFTKVGQDQRSRLAELDPNTGAVRPAGAAEFAGVHASGTTHIYKIDVNPAGTQLTAIGNFRTVNGVERVQIATLDVTGPATLINDWRTTKYERTCFAGFDYYIRDIEYSPDGTYFTTASTGGYPNAPTSLCDAVARWDADDRGQDVQPAWIDHSGGDSYYSVAATGAVVYVGGHQRWFNNPYASDAVGPGAVSRQGIGAVDPANGVPLTWDPVRTRGRGVFDMVATDDGLWVGSDTDRIGHGELHGRIAFFPLAGGGPVPQPDPAALPVDAYTVGASSARYLYRVNTGGEAVASLDAGPAWSADTSGNPSPYRNGGSNEAGWAAVPDVDGTVPVGTPDDLFASERWDPGDAPEMSWDFPVPAGRDIEVRLYLANRCTCTDDPGERRFDVRLDGSTVLNDYDIVADVGHDVGTMKAFTRTSDGNVDIDFGHVTENPLINGIEIVDLDAPPDPDTPVTVREFDGDDATAAEEVAEGSISWASVRGGFFLDGQLYLASSSGTLTRRSFDGSAYGSPTTLQLYGLTQFQAEMAQMTGLFYLDGYLYFTLFNDPNMYRRGFSVESGIVAALRDTVPSGGIDWRVARGMFHADGGLYWSASATGDLHRIAFTTAPQAGTDVVVSGPGADGQDWRGQAMFTGPGPAPNQPPTADIEVTCAELTCTFDGSGSTDPDGTVVDHEWAFGDGDTATGAEVTHDFDEGGTYQVQLTVTDDDGSTDVTSTEVVIAESGVTFVGSAEDQATTSKKVHSLVVPLGVQAGDVLILGLSVNSGTTVISDPTGWTRMDAAATSSLTTVLWARTATASDAGSVVSVTTDAFVRDALVLGAYRGAVVAPSGVDVAAETVNRASHTTPTRTAPAGSWVVSLWADKTAATTAWTAPVGQLVRETGAGSGGGHVSWLLTDSGGGGPAGEVGGLTATADSASAQATMATVVLAPTTEPVPGAQPAPGFTGRT